LTSLEEKMLEHFEEVVINKSLVEKAGINRDYPAFVVDWVVSRYIRNGEIDSEAIAGFMDKHFPDKTRAQQVKRRLYRGEEVRLIDRFGVQVNFKQSRLDLAIPSLDIRDGQVSPKVANEHEVLFSGNAWGVGTLVFVPGDNKDGSVVLQEFRPFQTFTVDLNYFRDQRKWFSLEEWVDLLIRSMEYDPGKFSFEEKRMMLYRLIPVVQQRTNMIELAPKGTGKSYVYSRMSKYVWLVSGGTITRAQLLYDMSRKKAGLLTAFDQVVFDEVQSIKFNNPEEIIGALKGYLESGSYKVGEFEGTSAAGLSILGNIPLSQDLRPRSDNLVNELPEFMSETAFLDRFHGILPGWRIPRLTVEHRVKGMGLKADYLSEIYHEFRRKNEYDQFVEQHLATKGDMRDSKAVKRIAAGLLKLLFPDLATVTAEDFELHCYLPARDLRQRLRSQLALLDPEYREEIDPMEVVF